MVSLSNHACRQLALFFVTAPLLPSFLRMQEPRNPQGGTHHFPLRRGIERVSAQFPSQQAGSVPSAHCAAESTLTTVPVDGTMVHKVRDAIRLVTQDGWFHVRTRGSHRHYRHPSKPGRLPFMGGREKT